MGTVNGYATASDGEMVGTLGRAEVELALVTKVLVGDANVKAGRRSRRRFEVNMTGSSSGNIKTSP